MGFFSFFQGLNIYLIPATLIFGIVCVVLAIWIILAGIKYKLIVARSLDMALLLVLVPAEKESENGGSKMDKMKEKVAVMEQFFAGLISMREANFWRKKFIGDPHIAFEIANMDGQVRFMIGAPKTYKNFIEKQLLGVFPAAKIEEMKEDYTIFSEDSAVGISLAALAKRSIYPIKTYKKIESDSLGEIVNAFSKLGNKDGAAIQIIAKPAEKGWNKAGIEMAKKIHEGKGESDDSGIIGDIGKGIIKELGGIISIKKENPEDKSKDLPKNITPAQQALVEALESKAGQHGFAVNLRVVASADTKESAASLLNSLEGSFAQFHSQNTNAFQFKRKFFPKNKKDIWNFIFRSFSSKEAFVLGTEELASIFHLPSVKDIGGIKRLEAKEAPISADAPKEGLYLGDNLYRGSAVPVKIKTEDRRRHMYVIGGTGTGKSVFFTNSILQDIKNGAGVCVIDPHGTLIDEILSRIPKERAEDVIVFDPAYTERPLGFNLFEAKNEGQKDLLSLEAMSIFLKIFGAEVFGPRIQDYFRNGALTLMSDDENPGTIIDIVRLFTDDDFQAEWVLKVKNPIVKSFWENQMAKTGAREKQEMVPFFAAKFGAFITNTTMRNIIGQSHSAFNFRDVMDEGKILLVSLSKGTIGELNMSLLGMIIVAKLQMAAMSRADMPERERKDFYLYVDEFQNFASSTFESILSEARKYRLSLIMAHQYLAQIENVGGDFEKKVDLKKSVFGNVGSIVAFRTGIEDAEVLEKEFLPEFDKNDIANIKNLNAYVKLLINGVRSSSFNMFVPFPKDSEHPEIGKSVRELSALRCGRDRELVENEIYGRLRLFAIYSG